MKETGILMTPENYGKCEDESKTKTRRLNGLKEINESPDSWELTGMVNNEGWPTFRWIGGERLLSVKCPYGTVGDRLYVKEGLERGSGGQVIYRRDKKAVGRFPASGPFCWIWKRNTLSPLHMPKWAARLWLELTAVRVERIQEISHDDVIAEGYSNVVDASEFFHSRWDKINGPGAWEHNDWVWVLEYKMVTP